MSDRTPILPQGLSASLVFAPGVQVGDPLFISGQVVQDNEVNLAGPGGCEAPTRHIISRIQTVAEAAVATMRDVVKTTTILTDVAFYPAFSRVRAETFPSNPPASSTVIVAALVRPEFLVEIEAIVHIPG